MNQRENKLFLAFDLEVVAIAPTMDQLPARLRELWITRANRHWPGADPAEKYLAEATFMPEFSRIICIGYGRHEYDDRFYIDVVHGAERAILEHFSDIVDLDRATKKLEKETGLGSPGVRQEVHWLLVGHAIRMFDIPFLCKRYIINRLPIPQPLLKASQGINVADTAVLWDFGAPAGRRASLDLLCEVLNLPSPKAGMHGGQVAEYYAASRIQEIAEYCAQDVLAVARAYARITYLEDIPDEVVTSGICELK